ncbi:MAG: ATP-binding protein [Polyangiales bacterium]
MPTSKRSTPSGLGAPDIARLNLALIQLTPDGRCVFVSERWCELTGMSQEKALELGWVRCLHPEDSEPLLPALESGKFVPSEHADEFRVLRAGRQRWMHSDTTSMQDESGTHTGYLSIFTDITERVASEQRFRLLFEQSSEPHLFLDEVGLVLDGNRATLRLLGLDEIGQLRGAKLLSHSPLTQPNGRVSAEIGTALVALSVLRGSHRFEWTFQHASGEPVPVEVAASCILLEDRRAILAVLRDLTMQKSAEREILASREAALDALRTKAQFLANMSHEIRTPMNGVLGMLELLQDSRLSSSQREYLAAARTSARNLLSIIDDILDFSKLEASKVQVETIPMLLEPVLRDSLRTVAAKAHEKRLELVLELGGGVPERISGDPVRLRQVLTNLVGNAVKFTEAGEVVLSVTQLRDEADKTATRLRFSVQDSGIGIASENLERVAESFTQADASTTRRYGGTGLGLSISKELISLMGGKLGVTSELQVGSTFFFDVPLVVEPSRPSQPTEVEVDEPRSVVVVQQHPRARRALCTLVAKLGFDVDVADDAAHALSLLQSDPGCYRAVLLEERDNERSSALTSRLQQLSESFCGTVVLLRPYAATSGARDEEPAFARVLRKPVMPSELRSVLHASEAEGAHRPSAPDLTRAPNLRPLFVLLVEDQAINAFFAHELLSRRGHDVVHAMTAAEAVAACEAQPFDVVLMDVHMADMDGHEATRRIRANEQASGKRRVPIVALTALATADDAKACLQAGMDTYLGKPFTAEALDAVLADVTGSRARPAPHRAAEASAPTPAAQAYDHTELLARVGGRHELVDELIRAFLENIDQTMQDLNGSAAADDLEHVHEHAHLLKGTVQLLCADSAANLAAALERAASERRSDVLFPLMGPMNAEIARLCAALRAHRMMGRAPTSAPERGSS